MRLFIAIDLDEVDYFAGLQEQIKNIAGVRKTLTSSYHITLKFLGDVIDSKKDAIIKALYSVKIVPFSLECEHVGVFPSIHNPRVIWAGFSKGDIQSQRPFFEGYLSCIELQKRIDQALKPLGFQPDKEFIPHVTLVRIKDATPEGRAVLVETIKKIHVLPKRFEVNGFKLIKSSLSESGPRYEMAEGFVSQ